MDHITCYIKGDPTQSHYTVSFKGPWGWVAKDFATLRAASRAARHASRTVKVRVYVHKFSPDHGCHLNGAATFKDGEVIDRTTAWWWSGNHRIHGGGGFYAHVHGQAY